jgi:DNA-binding IclR family transcriptional regulator
MTRSSPGVARVVAILNFMAEHPGESFTLTDFVRALKLSRATCHALLAGLVEANYLYRTNDKSYVLGPALIHVGRVADEHLSPVRIALPEMRVLADEYDAVCTAVFREGNEIIVRERAASRSNLGWSVPRGTRLPLKPPAGTNWVSWSPQADADAFIDSTLPGVSKEYREELHAGIRLTRELGFQIILRTSDEQRGSIGWLFDEPDAVAGISVATSLDEAETYPLASLAAPVFDAQKHVAFVLVLSGLGGSYSGAQIMQIGNRLRDAGHRLTDFLAGRQP